MDDRQGAVWNFPAARSGNLRLRLRLPTGSRGCHIALLDRWLNPTDPVVHSYAQIMLHLSQDLLTPDRWHELRIDWTPDVATWQIGDGKPLSIDWLRPARDVPQLSAPAKH